MVTNAPDGFIRCRNCGNFFPEGEGIGDLLCSEDCARRYARCTTCGRYYPADSSEFPDCCGRECFIPSKTHTKGEHA